MRFFAIRGDMSRYVATRGALSRYVAFGPDRARTACSRFRVRPVIETSCLEPMDAQRLTAWSWWLVAALCRLLLMAAAATDDPELRATRRARAACSWAAKLFVIEDYVDDSRYSAGGERCTVMCRNASRSDALCAGLTLRPRMAIRRYIAIRGAMSRYVAMSRAVCLVHPCPRTFKPRTS